MKHIRLLQPPMGAAFVPSRRTSSWARTSRLVALLALASGQVAAQSAEQQPPAPAPAPEVPPPEAPAPPPEAPPEEGEPPVDPPPPPEPPPAPPPPPSVAPDVAPREPGAEPPPVPEPPAHEPPAAEQPPVAPPPAGQPSTEPAPGDRSPPPSEAEVLELTLDPAVDEPLEISVVGSRVSRAPGSAHVITGKQLERFRRDDPTAIVSQAPGVYVRQEDGVGLRPNIGIRGANADRSKKVTLMEDGILFGPAPYSAPAAYYFPLMARIVSVRVIKGPSAISYGPQTVGGAIDFTSRFIPSLPSGALDVGVGEYGYLKTHAHFGASNDQFGFLVEGVRLHDEGFKQLPNDADTGATRNDWMVKTSYEPDPAAANRHRFSAKFSYSDEVSNETYLGLTDEDFRDDPYQRYPASALDQMKYHRTGLALTHRFDDAEGLLNTKTDLYRFDFTRSWRKLNGFRGAALSGVLEDPDDPANAEYYAVLAGEANGATAADTLLIGPNDRTFVSQGAQAQVTYKPTTGEWFHAVEAGVRLHNDSIDRRHSQTGYVMTDGLLMPEGSAEDVTTANVATTTALALHASDAVTWRRLTLTPGLRVELIWSSFDDDLAQTSNDDIVAGFMPGLGGYYALTEAFGVLAGVYRGFSPPAPGSEEHVDPEYSVNYEAGLRLSAPPLRAEVIGFLNDYQNLTDICTLSSGCLSEDLDRQFDAGEATILGVEAHIAHDFEFEPLTIPLVASYTLTHAEFDNSFQSQDPVFGNVQAGDQVPYVPRHQFSGSIGVEGDAVGAVVGAQYVSAMREEPSQASLDDVVATDEQFWIDVGARYLPIEALTVYANVKNALGATHLVSRRPYGARPNAPRWVQAGAQLKF